MPHHYGDSHMGPPIGFINRGCTLIVMGTPGERVRTLRKTQGLTQPVLAKSIGIDQSTLSDIERGAGFSAEILIRLAEELGTTCEYIMRGRGVKTEEMRRAQQAVGALTDEQRLELFTALMQPGAVDAVVEAKIPVTKAKPATKADEAIKRARIPSGARKPPAKKTA